MHNSTNRWCNSKVDCALNMWFCTDRRISPQVHSPCKAIGGYGAHFFEATSFFIFPLPSSTAVSNPLHLLAICCIPNGKHPSTWMYLEYNGRATSPLSPLSTSLMMPCAISAGVTRGPKNLLGACTCSNIFVLI